MTEPKKKNIYPAMIVLLLGSFLLFSIWSAFQASNLGSEVTDTDYYSKGLRYNTTMIEKKAAAVLGWNLSVNLNERTLQFSLSDHDGVAVERAIGSIYLAIPNAAENVNLPLQEVAAGLYTVKLQDEMTGTIQARLDLVREGVRLNRQLLLNL